MNARNPMLFRDFRDPLHDPSIGFGCRIVLAFRDLIGCGTKRAFRRPVTRQSSGCEGTIRDHPDLLLVAERQHLPLLFAVDEVQVILHRAEAGPPLLLGDVQRLLELPRDMAEAPMYRALPAFTTSCSASIVSSMGVWSSQRWIW